MKKIQQMFQLQQSLNDATNGSGWEQGITKNNKKIDWGRCIYLEAAELIDSYPWKHWKNINASPDYANIKIEIVDIWHFIMSEALRVYKVNDLGDIKELSEKAVNLPAYQQFSDDHHQADLDIYAEMEKVEEMVAVLFAKADIHQLIDAFFNMSASLNLKLSELYQLYIGKNILNQFRQDHGYKEGSYIKEWHGVEDNVVMQKLLNDKSDITPDELYQGLEKNYPN
jgi:dimeric dUTPase (all-alpha-NTP-PPase superfamily)